MARHRPPRTSRQRVQAISITGAVPGNLTPVVGLVFAEGLAPNNILHVSSAVYSLGSPPIGGMQRIAVLNYSLSSPSIPGNYKRVAILPDS